jgi:branched-subunit amino acid transport protein
MLTQIVRELRHHAPFTVFGAVTGIIVMIASQGLSSDVSYKIFYTLHPVHVVLSALVTTSLYKYYQCPVEDRKCGI